MPHDVNKEERGFELHSTHVPSAKDVHCALYWPTGHKEVVHAEHNMPLRKNPSRQVQAQLSRLYGTPEDVKSAFGGRIVHPTHSPSVSDVHPDLN